MQTTDTVLMVRPAAFGFNQQTAANNFFQQVTVLSTQEVHDKAVAEFDTMVARLQENGIHVLEVSDTPVPQKPDAIFPNNWFSTSPEGLIHIFPMYAPNRREEKRDDILQALARMYRVNNVMDWTEFEADGKYLEGTGSMVLDHQYKVVYACISPRTDEILLQKWATANGFKAISFTAMDDHGQLIYHTNVMLCIGQGFAVLCAEAIQEELERIAVLQLLEATGHEVIIITLEQVKAFAGNMLHLRNKDGHYFIAMSRTAYDVLTSVQKERLQAYGTLLSFDVPVIEKVNGGSVRCMMAEIFLPAGSQ